MKDPKISKLVKELNEVVVNLNRVNENLRSEGCYFRLDMDDKAVYSIQNFTQSVKYDEELNG